MAVKLVSREQVALEQNVQRPPGPVNALGFVRSAIKAEESDSSDLAESRERQRPHQNADHSVQRPVAQEDPALTDEDSESSQPRRRQKRKAVSAGHSKRQSKPPSRHYQSGVVNLMRSCRPERTLTRKAPRVSRRVRQLQAQHEDELRRQKRLVTKRLEAQTETEEPKHDVPETAACEEPNSELQKESQKEPQKGPQKEPNVQNVQNALPSEQFEQLQEHEERAPRVQSDPLPVEQKPADPAARPKRTKAGQVKKGDLVDPVVGKERQPFQEATPSTPVKAPVATSVGTPPGTPIPQRAAPALALRRWRQARKRQHLLRQMTAMRGEMKFERRQLLSALQGPFNTASLEAELQKHGRDLKSRFQRLYVQMYSERQERSKRLKLIQVLSNEHMELQRAFVKLMNGCGFARPSALRTSPRTQDTDEDQTDQDEDEDDDVIVREESQDDQAALQESQESDSKQKDELKKEMKENALREEMLLRLIDRGNYSKLFASR